MGLWIYRISYFDSILLGFHLISRVFVLFSKVFTNCSGCIINLFKRSDHGL